MTPAAISVLVVDDDFRVAQLHARFVDELAGFETVGVAATAAAAEADVQRLHPELVLLDNYLPDEPGVSLAPRLGCDVIMVTADASPVTIRAAVSAGALNVVVKPFAAELLQSRLRAYERYRRLVGGTQDHLDQAAVDRIFDALRQGDRPPAQKGQSTVTARLVTAQLQASAEPVTAAAVAEQLGISRATAQRYLAALADSGRARVSMRYGTTGRPEHEYTWLGGRG